MITTLHIRREWFKSLNWGFIATLIITGFFGFTSIAHQNVAIVVQSYVLGDVAVASGTILAFVMGGYLVAGMYIAWRRKQLDDHKAMVRSFVKAELVLLAMSAFSAFIVFYLVNYLPEIGEAGTYAFYAVMNGLVGFEDLLLLTLIGVSIPKIRDAGTVFQSLSALGGMFAGMVLGLLFIPRFGITLTPVILGYIDGVSVLIVLIVFRKELGIAGSVVSSLAWVAIMLGIVLATANQQQFDLLIKRPFYEGHIVFTEGDLYGDMVFVCTKKNSQVCQFYMDGHIQWGSHPGDEELYHDLITHIPLSIVLDRNMCDEGCVRPLSVLVLGGGDGMVLRELVKYNSQLVGNIDLVDLNETLTQELAREDPMVLFNGNSFADERVLVYNQDAFDYVRSTEEGYDLIIVDLVDPRNDAVAKLYSEEFYAMAARHLSRGGVFITQASSPASSGRAFWRINYTLEQVFASVIPYHANIYSFGDWGFAMASSQPIDSSNVNLREEMTALIDDELFQMSLYFPKSMLEVGYNTVFPEDTREAVYKDGQVSSLTQPIVRDDYVRHNRWEMWD